MLLFSRERSASANLEMTQSLQLSGKNFSEVKKKNAKINKIIGNLIVII